MPERRPFPPIPITRSQYESGRPYEVDTDVVDLIVQNTAQMMEVDDAGPPPRYAPRSNASNPAYPVEIVGLDVPTGYIPVEADITLSVDASGFADAVESLLFIGGTAHDWLVPWRGRLELPIDLRVGRHTKPRQRVSLRSRIAAEYRSSPAGETPLRGPLSVSARLVVVAIAARRPDSERVLP